MEKYNNLNENLLKGLNSTFELAEERMSKFEIDHYELCILKNTEKNKRRKK